MDILKPIEPKGKADSWEGTKTERQSIFFKRRLMRHETTVLHPTHFQHHFLQPPRSKPHRCL